MYLIDLHVHTSETSSCGKVSAVDTVDLYKQHGYNATVITDHYYDGFFDSLGEISWGEKISQYLKGYHAALVRGNAVGMTVLLGAEFRFCGSANDYLVYGIDEEFLIRYPRLYEMPIAEVKNILAEHSCLLFQAHPFRPSASTEHWALMDGIEVYNASMRHQSRNDKALEFAHEHNLNGISGSDFHQLEDVARGGITCNQIVESNEQLVEIIQNRKFDLIMNAK